LRSAERPSRYRERRKKRLPGSEVTPESTSMMNLGRSEWNSSPSRRRLHGPAYRSDELSIPRQPLRAVAPRARLPAVVARWKNPSASGRSCNSHLRCSLFRAPKPDGFSNPVRRPLGLSRSGSRRTVVLYRSASRPGSSRKAGTGSGLFFSHPGEHYDGRGKSPTVTTICRNLIEERLSGRNRSQGVAAGKEVTVPAPSRTIE